MSGLLSYSLCPLLLSLSLAPSYIFSSASSISLFLSIYQSPALILVWLILLHLEWTEYRIYLSIYPSAHLYPSSSMCLSCYTSYCRTYSPYFLSSYLERYIYKYTI
ncbi:hypothetical protein BDV09DRAFT_120432 [Aspergillus tetrazonus]